MNKTNLKLCPLCRKQVEWFDRCANTTAYRYKCECCGEFEISYNDILILDQEDDEYREQHHMTVCKNTDS